MTNCKDFHLKIDDMLFIIEVPDRITNRISSKNFPLLLVGTMSLPVLLLQLRHVHFVETFHDMFTTEYSSRKVDPCEIPSRRGIRSVDVTGSLVDECRTSWLFSKYTIVVKELPRFTKGPTLVLKLVRLFCGHHNLLFTSHPSMF